MSESIKNIVLVSASPKVDQDWAVSSFLAKRGELLLNDKTLDFKAIADIAIDVKTIYVRSSLMHHKTEQAFDELQSADAIVLIFPLYFFCMPAMLTRFLQDFVVKYPSATHVASVYAIVNCGFPEPEINQEAMRVVECFAQQTGRVFLGGVMIGGGGMLIGAQAAPFMRPVFEHVDDLFSRLKRNTLLEQQDTMLITQIAPKFPKWLYFVGGNSGWKSMARRNKLKIREIYRQPYQR